MEHQAAAPDSFLIKPIRDFFVESSEPSGCPVPEGLPHHWIGSESIPHARLAKLLSVMQDSDDYTPIFPPAVVESLVVSHRDDVFNDHLKFIQKGFGHETGLLADFQSRYVRVDSRSGYIETESTKLTERQNPSSPTERPLSLAGRECFIEKSYSVMLYRETGSRRC